MKDILIGFFGTADVVKVVVGGVFLVIGALLISIIKANFEWKAFVYNTRWLKAFVGLICSAILMRFVPLREQITDPSVLYAYSFGLGLGSDVSIRLVMGLRKWVVAKFEKI